MWAEMKHRFPVKEDFWGVIDPDGNWIDSAMQFMTAVHWVACYAGYMDLKPEEELAMMNELGYSIVRSTMLAKMADAGLIK